METKHYGSIDSFENAILIFISEMFHYKFVLALLPFQFLSGVIV